MFISEGIVEQHIHGCFGIDFMSCGAKDIVEVAKELVQYGVTAFFPTVMTDSLDKIKERISVIKEAILRNTDKSAQIAGVHLEGPFINSEKAGIHQKEFIQELDVKTFKQIEDEIIKIVTLAPELDKTGRFIKYLKSKNIKISAGHCIGSDLSKVNQVTHLYNAMGNFHHRNPSTVVSALLNDDIYAEIIADLKHVNEEVLKITFKQKPLDKILLISDALPLAHSDKKEQIFAGQTIYNTEGILTGKDGTIAGSSMLLCDIASNLVNKKILTMKDIIKTVSSNQLKYHDIKNNLKVSWSKSGKIEKTEFVI